MASLEVTGKAEEDVADVLSFTLSRWGETKYWEYSDLIEEAYRAITAKPTPFQILPAQLMREAQS
jgi:plasmid stabilization system protein ParE